ncbi:hypothetical protein [Secundilactobacillus muriivasis]
MHKSTIYKSALLLLLPLGIIGATTTTSASAKNSLRHYPARFQRTWYHYTDGRYEKMRFTPNHLSSHTYYEKWYYSRSPLHTRNLNLDGEQVSSHQNWTFATFKSPWLWVYGWNQTAGAGDYYKVKIHSYHGVRFRVLSAAGGAGVWTYEHFYATKKVAKVMKNRHFSGERYYPEIN